MFLNTELMVHVRHQELRDEAEAYWRAAEVRRSKRRRSPPELASPPVSVASATVRGGRSFVLSLRRLLGAGS